MKPTLRYQRDIDAVFLRLPAEGAIVDCEANRGEYASLFVSQGRRVYAFSYLPSVDAQPAELLTPMITDIESTLIPHRTCAAVWATHTMQYLEPSAIVSRLAVFHDWLMPGGLVSFCLREGEGAKRIEAQGLAERVSKTVLLYQPAQVDALLASAGFQATEAWTDGPIEARVIHVIAAKL